MSAALGSFIPTTVIFQSALSRFDSACEAIFSFYEMILPDHWQRDRTRPAFPWAKTPKPNVSLDAAGLVALADLTTIARRTALTGTSTLLDALVLCPGLHRQQAATELNLGEYPAVAAMTSGYVFRVENPATVLYLQKVGRTGHLTTLSVAQESGHSRWWLQLLALFFTFQNASLVSAAAYLTAVLMTIVALVLVAFAGDHWGAGVLSVLILARLCNVLVIRRRCEMGWKGASEPGVNGDLLVLLSQDRWIRMRGPVDDLKAVTSGEWLREPSFIESSVTAFATVLVYLNAALASNVDESGKIILLILLISSVGLLGIANEATGLFSMHGRVIRMTQRPKKYQRRLEMVEELIDQTGRDDWAMRLGMIVKRKDAEKPMDMQASVVM